MSTRRASALPIAVGAALVALVATIVLPLPLASAFWTPPVLGARSSAVQAATIPRVGTPAVAVSNRSDVTVSWPEATLSDGTPVSGYVVTRTSSAGATTAATGGCAALVVASTCTETGVPDGRWTYAVAARFATSWTGPASATSATAITDTVAPTNALSLSSVTGGASLSGSTLWYRGAAAGSFRIVNAVSDTLSGPASSSTGVLTGASVAGWTHSPSSTGTPAGGPFASNPFAWTAGTTSTPTLGIAGLDVAGNTAASSLAFANDSTAPTGGTISYASGTVRGTPTATVSITLGSASDAASGIPSTGRILQQASATLSGDTCGSLSSWSDVATFAANPASASVVTASVGTCVQYRYVVRDAVGNERSTAGGIVKVKPTYASVVQGTSGLVNAYRFDGTGAQARTDSKGSNTATTTAMPTVGAAGAIAGDASTSLSYDGTDDFLRISRTIDASFSIELWFRSNQGIGTGTQWYNGAGLVDAEVGGVTNDFGIALAADGRIMAGVGNVAGSDRTISSSPGYNDNVWHHVVMTRNASTGLVELWVDGIRVNTVTGGTQSLSAAASIDIGRLQTGIQYFRGQIDEVALYSRVLTQAEIQAHHANAL